MSVELIKKVSVEVASESTLAFLKGDIESILKEDSPRNQKETVKRLEHALVNANYAGDLKAGKLSFILNDYLNGFDISDQLTRFQEAV